jgi:flagellar biosynthesis anti-sigma factor FlgM
MRKTEYDPIPHASDVPHGHDTPIPPPAPASADSEQHALAVQARAVAQAAPEVRVARVEAARRALQEGTLTLDGQALAEKLLEAVRAERRHA